MYNTKYPIASINKIKIEFFNGKAFKISSAVDYKIVERAMVGNVAIFIPA